MRSTPGHSMTVYDTTLTAERLARTTTRRPLGLLGSLAGVLLTLKPSARGSPEVPGWLRRDVGLPATDTRRTHWDIR